MLDSRLPALSGLPSELLMPDQHFGSEQGLAIFPEQTPLQETKWGE